MFALVFALPLADEIIAWPQYRDLCRGAGRFEFGPGEGCGDRLRSRSTTGRAPGAPGNAVPRRAGAAHTFHDYVDAASGGLVLRFRSVRPLDSLMAYVDARGGTYGCCAEVLGRGLSRANDEHPGAENRAAPARHHRDRSRERRQPHRRPAVRAGLVEPIMRTPWSGITGGVVRHRARCQARQGSFCVKRALANSKVAADWRAPVERNRHEVAWMRVVNAIVPSAVPRILADRSADGWFAMDYLDSATHPLWKAQLRDGSIDAGFAAAVGTTLSHPRRDLARCGAGCALRHRSHLLSDPPRTLPRGHRGQAYGLRAATACAHRHQANKPQALVHGDISPRTSSPALSGRCS